MSRQWMTVGPDCVGQRLQTAVLVGLLVALGSAGCAGREKQADPSTRDASPPGVIAVDGSTARQANATAPVPLAEAEPNDTPDTAQRILGLPALVEGSIDRSDTDRFVLEIADSGPHILDAWSETGGLRVRVVQPASRGAAERTLATSVVPERVGNLGVIRGSYQIVVDAPVIAERRPFRLHISVKPWVAGFDWEPDDTPQARQKMAEMKPRKDELARHRARGSLSRQGDVDCFAVPFSIPPEGAHLAFELRLPGNARGRLDVFDVGDAEAKIPPRRIGGAVAPSAGATVVIPAIGGRSWESSYTACVAAEGPVDASQEYVLEARLFTPKGSFEFEPNDTRETASALPLDVPVAGYLVANDTDFFRVAAAGPAAVTVTVRSPVAAELRLLEEKGREIGRVNAGDPPSGKDGSVTIVAAGRGVAFTVLRPLAAGSATRTYSIVAAMRREDGL